MKRIIFLLLVVLAGSFVFSSELVLYSYDSMIPLIESIKDDFLNETGIELNLKTYGDSGAVFTKLISEGEKTQCDIFIGIDSLMVESAKEKDIFLSYKPSNLNNIVDENLLVDGDFYLIPYDYGPIAFVYREAETGKLDGLKMEDLTEKRYSKSIIVQDPRTSSTGLSFLMWTHSLFGDDYIDFWKNFKGSLLTITMGWDDAFQKFEMGEAPIMLSYGTDGAYSYEYYGSTEYQIFIPEPGYVQIETAGIIKYSDNPEEAKIFMEYMLSDNFQKNIPLNQWMFPVIEVELPESFSYAVKPDNIVNLDLRKDIDELISGWESAIY